MKVLGIGNAIVDVLCKVDDQFIKDHSLTKGTMKLVDEQEFKNLLSNLKIESTVSGGSVANSIVGMSQLGDNVSFIGKVFGCSDAFLPLVFNFRGRQSGGPRAKPEPRTGPSGAKVWSPLIHVAPKSQIVYL